MISLRYKVEFAGGLTRPAVVSPVNPIEAGIEFDPTPAAGFYSFSSEGVSVHFNVIPLSDVLAKRPSTVKLRTYAAGQLAGIEFGSIIDVPPFAEIEVPVVKWGRHSATLPAPEGDVEFVILSGWEA